MDYYEEKFRESGIIIRMLWRLLILTLALTLAMCVMTLLESCQPMQKVVTVPEVHEQHHWHTDSIKERDSTHTERETIIREVDSAAMAKYGIQMERNQRAWLILQREMEQRLHELERKSAQKDIVRDSIPKPYPVYVEKQLTWYQNAKLKFSEIVIGIFFFIIMLVFIYRRRPR